MSVLKRWMVALSVIVLSACGGGGGATGDSPFGGPGSGGTGSGSGGSGSGSGGGSTTPTVTLTLQLVDASGAVTSSIAPGQPVQARAVLKSNGAAVADEIVRFSVEQSADLVKLDPSSGSLLSDAGGQAALTVSSLGSATGAGRVVAAAKVSGVEVTAGANFFATGSTSVPPASLTLGPVQIGSPSVSAYGTTGVQVKVFQGSSVYTSPVTVNFTTSCPAGKATITSSASTQPDGTAVATFVDNGCAPAADATVVVTASISTDSKSASMTVKSPTTGSLRFVSVNPSDKSITLRGQGGNGRQENATITFKLVDVAGQGVGDADVCFDVSTYIGGLNLDGFSPSALPAKQGSTALCGTDALSQVRYVKRTNADGTVSVQVNSGTVPTPVRVRARALYPAGSLTALETFSDTLSISTGLPLQRSFSLSVDKANIDGGNFDGEIATLTVRLADQFSNPVPDGTVVNFIASGAAVCTADNGACKTTNGACSCNLVSQARRPADRRVVVMAYAVGLEDYDDRNADNVYTLGTDGFDLARQDLGDAYVDANKDGKFQQAASGDPGVNGDIDIPIPYQRTSNGTTVFNAAGDGVRGTAHIRASTVIYLSQDSSSGDPTVVLPLSQLLRESNLLTGNRSVPFVRMTPDCPSGTPVPQASIAFAMDDGSGNPMAASTSLTAIDVSDNLSAGAFRPDRVLAIGARAPNPLIDNPAGIENLPKFVPWTTVDPKGNVVSQHSITVRGVETKCSGNASFGLEVASPRGGKRAARVLIESEPRNTARFGFDVRYRDDVNLSLSNLGSRAVEITSLSAVAPPSDTVTGYRIEWGDGVTDAGATSVLSASHVSHTYAATGTYVVRVTVTTSSGATYSTRQTLSVF